MKKIYLTFILAFGMIAQEGWAPPPGQGGATAAPDISKCDLNPSKQTKVKIKSKDGKEQFICTGQAVCGTSVVPVSCKVNEREPCPMAKKCVEFSQGVKDIEERGNLITYLLKKYDSKYSKKLSQSSIDAFKSNFPKITSWPKSNNEEERILGVMLDWGQCRDDCYNVRMKCIRGGTSSHQCDEGYDDCVEWCDKNRLTIEKLFGSP